MLIENFHKSPDLIYWLLGKKILLTAISAALILSYGCSPVPYIGGLGTVLALNELDKLQRQDDPSQTLSVKKNTQHTKPAYQINQALTEYHKLNFEKCTAICRIIVYSRNASDTDKASALILLGAVSYQLGRKNSARNYFRQAYRHNSLLQPSGDVFPPELVKFYIHVNQK